MKQLLLTVALLCATPSAAVAHPGAEHVLETLSQSIKLRPKDPKLYMQRGSTYSDDGQLELALADFQKAEALGEPIVVAFHQGVLHYRMGDLNAAKGYFDTFLKHFPGHPPSLEYRARLLRDAGDHRGALADFNAYFAMQKQPNPGHYISAANMLKELKGKGIPGALAMLDQGMQRLGIIPQLQRYAIELELGRNNTALAIQRLSSLEPVLGESPDWKVDMGELLLRAGKPSEAHWFFDAALEQLGTLRKTVARQRVLDKLQKRHESAKGNSKGCAQSLYTGRLGL
jgi:tetratricopeptide (TPR) repeat protein